MENVRHNNNNKMQDKTLVCGGARVTAGPKPLQRLENKKTKSSELFSILIERYIKVAYLPSNSLNLKMLYFSCSSSGF